MLFAEYDRLLRLRVTSPSEVSGKPSGATNVVLRTPGLMAPKKNRRSLKMGKPASAPPSDSSMPTVLTVPLRVWMVFHVPSSAFGCV